MLRIVVIICALAGLLAAVSLEVWLRSRIVRNDSSANPYAEARSRYSGFWSIQYLPIFVSLALIGVLLFTFADRLNAAVFLGGAVLCIVSVAAGSLTSVTGAIAASSIAVTGDIRNAMKSAYRSASVMGLASSSIALLGLAVFFFFFNADYASSFALGASAAALCIGLSGTTYSCAYDQSAKSTDFTDQTGMFIGNGSDHTETFILSACAAALLAEVGEDTSGVAATFTAASAARYPLIVLASGIVASIIGTMIFRGQIKKKDPSTGITAGNIAAGFIVIAASAYFSDRILQSYMYAFCVAAGVAAVVLSGEFSRLFSPDGLSFRRSMADTKKAGASVSAVYSLSIGMVSIAIPVVLTTAAIVISYHFANYYGIALAAAGVSSMAAVDSAVRGFSINTASASDIASIMDPDSESPSPADLLLTASIKTEVIGKTYSVVSVYVTLVAMFTSLSVIAGDTVSNLFDILVFIGMLTGSVMVFICAGLMIRSLRLTTKVLTSRLNDPDDPVRPISSIRGLVPLAAAALIVPIAVGAAGGITSIASFVCAAAVTGICVMFAFTDSGRYFQRVSVGALGTVIKFMVAVALVFVSVFNGFGGFFN